MPDKELNAAMYEYMREGREWRQEVTEHMATTANEIKHFTDYVRECDIDRKDLAKRITGVETHQKVNSGIIAAGLTAMSIVGGFLEFLRKS